MADQLAADRIRAAREHLTLVSQGDWDGVIATFRHARYEVYRTATIYDGEEAVRGYLNASRKIYPDLNHQIIAIAANDDIVLVEFWLKGTHLGPLLVGNKAYQATGRPLCVRQVMTFEFAPNSDKIACSRFYGAIEAELRALGLI